MHPIPSNKERRILPKMFLRKSYIFIRGFGFSPLVKIGISSSCAIAWIDKKTMVGNEKKGIKKCTPSTKHIAEILEKPKTDR